MEKALSETSTTGIIFQQLVVTNGVEVQFLLALNISQKKINGKIRPQ